jgi:hypothetical protein
MSLCVALRLVFGGHQEYVNHSFGQQGVNPSSSRGDECYLVCIGDSTVSSRCLNTDNCGFLDIHQPEKAQGCEGFRITGFVSFGETRYERIFVTIRARERLNLELFPA